MAFIKYDLIRDYNWGIYPYIEIDNELRDGESYIHVCFDEHTYFDVINPVRHQAEVLEGYAEMFLKAAKLIREQASE